MKRLARQSMGQVRAMFRACCWLVAGLLGTSFAGCADQSLDSSAANPGGTEVSSVPPRSPLADLFGTPPLNVSAWTDCTGLFSAQIYPGRHDGASPPPNWTGGNELATDISQLGLDCERISWGPFARPVKMVWEVHDNAPAPPACAGGRYERYYVVTRVFLEDGDLGAFLKTTYGLPVHQARVWRNQTWENGQRHDVWTWIPSGYGASWMENWRYNRSEFDTYDIYRNRYAWDNGSGISLMDERSVREWGSNGIVTPGEMNPPMLNAIAGGAPYLGRGTLWDDLDAESKIQRFGDYACKDPRPLD